LVTARSKGAYMARYGDVYENNVTGERA